MDTAYVHGEKLAVNDAVPKGSAACLGFCQTGVPILDL